MEKPIVVNPIPPQVVNERAAYGPFNLKDYLQAPDGSALRFSAELESGEALPKGLICTSDGIVTGIPARDTQGNYVILVTTENEAGSVKTSFVLTIKPSLAMSDADYFDKLKSQVWEALEKRLPIPDLSEMADRPVTIGDIYYLFERWGVLKIWDAFNLEPAGEPILLNLEGASQHYNVYDRGSCLVACPKDLFSYERTLEDGLQTARAVAREVYKRHWTIEIAGYEKLTRAAWVELQHLGDEYGKSLEIINFSPNSKDYQLYTTQADEIRLKGLS